MTSTKLVYAFPVVLTSENVSQNEVFVTFHEPNFFNNPWESLGLKITATVFWMIAFLGSCIIYTFVHYETQGYAASFRTVINQLVTWCYFYVSKNTSISIPYNSFILISIPDCCISNNCWRSQFDKGLDRTITCFHLLLQCIAERRNRTWISIFDVGYFCYEIPFHLQVETIKTLR